MERDDFNNNESSKQRPHSIEGKVSLILDLLQGNPIDPKDYGLIGDVRQTKQRLFALEQWKTKTVSWALGVSFGGGALVAFVLTVIFKK